MKRGINILLNEFGVNIYNIIPNMNRLIFDSLLNLYKKLIKNTSFDTILKEGYTQISRFPAIWSDKFTTIMTNVGFTEQKKYTLEMLRMTINEMSIDDLFKLEKMVDKLLKDTGNKIKAEVTILVKCQIAKRLRILPKINTGKLEILMADQDFVNKWTEDEKEKSLTVEAIKLARSTKVFGVDPRLTSLRIGQEDVFQQLLDTVENKINRMVEKSNGKVIDIFPPAMFRTEVLKNIDMITKLDNGESVQTTVQDIDIMDVGRLIRKYLSMIPGPMISFDQLIAIGKDSTALAGKMSQLLAQRKNKKKHDYKLQGYNATSDKQSARANVKKAIDNMIPFHKEILGKFLIFYNKLSQHSDIFWYNKGEKLVPRERWAKAPGIAYISILGLDKKKLANLRQVKNKYGSNNMFLVSVSGADFIITCINDKTIRDYLTAGLTGGNNSRLRKKKRKKKRKIKYLV